jgi:6-aminohexanoate-oligomer endohydrolase
VDEPRRTNDNTRLVPRTDSSSGRVLKFDFPGLEIGIAEYDEGPTGCTVFSFGRRASVSIDVRGGSPDVSAGHREVIEAVCFAGGSLYSAKSRQTRCGMRSSRATTP